MNKKYLAIIGIIIIGLAFTAVKLKMLKSSGKNQSPTVRIGLNPWIGHGIYFFAQEQGIFKKNGINVRLVEYDDNSVGKQLLNTDQIDVLSFTPDVLVALRAAGADVKAIAITDNSNGADGIVADSKIKSVSDLKGHAIAFESGSTSQLLLGEVLKNHGMALNDVTLINMPAGDAGAAFLAGKVDAAVSWEPWLSKAAQRPGGHLLANSKDLDVLPDMMIFRTDFVSKNPQVVKLFLKSYFDAVKLAKQNPDKIRHSLVQKYSLSNQETKEMMQKFFWFDLSGNQKNFSGNNSPVKKLAELANDIWSSQGLISQKADLTQVWDENFITNLNHEAARP